MKTTFEIPIYGIIVECFIVLRFLIKQENYIIIVNSSIILVSLFLVCLSIFHHIKDKIINEIETASAVKEVQNREREKSHRRSNFIITIGTIVYFLFFFIYIKLWSSSLRNDVISIFTLGLSMLDLSISNVVSNICIKKIQNNTLTDKK